MVEVFALSQLILADATVVSRCASSPKRPMFTNSHRDPDPRRILVCSVAEQSDVKAERKTMYSQLQAVLFNPAMQRIGLRPTADCTNRYTDS